MGVKPGTAFSKRAFLAFDGGDERQQLSLADRRAPEDSSRKAFKHKANVLINVFDSRVLRYRLQRGGLDRLANGSGEADLWIETGEPIQVGGVKVGF